MKLIMGEPGPGLIVEPGEYPNDSLSGNADNVSYILQITNQSSGIVQYVVTD